MRTGLWAFAAALAFMGGSGAFATGTKAGPLAAARVPLQDFVGPSGEITVLPHGDVVDPYFAMKALEIGQKGGLPIAGLRRDFLRWLLDQQRQAPPGRYCKAEGHWQRCEEPDAEDSRLALWLVVTHDALEGTMATAQRTSVLAAHQVAIDDLFALYDDQRHVFTVFPHRPAALFMDNCEVMQALKLIATERFSLPAQKRRAQRIRRDMLAALPVRFPVHDGLPQVSNEPGADSSTGNASGNNAKARPFYPDVVAALYPRLEGLPSGVPPGMVSYAQWQTRYRATWLSGQADPYPWGLIAWAAHEAGDASTACLWVSKSRDRRTGTGWNVLEAAVFESLSTHDRRHACEDRH